MTIPTRTGLGMAVLLAGCGVAARERVVVHDSAGVRITTLSSTLSEDGAIWNLEKDPVVDIGIAMGEAPYELDRVAGARTLPDGTIAVANGGTGEVRLFDSSGRYIRSMGRDGSGPGEFQRMAWIQVIPPDTLLVTDSELRRLTAIRHDGRPSVGQVDPGHRWDVGRRCPAG